MSGSTPINNGSGRNTPTENNPPESTTSTATTTTVTVVSAGQSSQAPLTNTTTVTSTATSTVVTSVLNLNSPIVSERESSAPEDQAQQRSASVESMQDAQARAEGDMDEESAALIQTLLLADRLESTEIDPPMELPIPIPMPRRSRVEEGMRRQRTEESSSSSIFSALRDLTRRLRESESALQEDFSWLETAETEESEESSALAMEYNYFRPGVEINACAENCLRVLDPLLFFDTARYAVDQDGVRVTEQVDIFEPLIVSGLRQQSVFEVLPDTTEAEMNQHYAPLPVAGTAHDLSCFYGGTEGGFVRFLQRLDPARNYIIRIPEGNQRFSGHYMVLRFFNNAWHTIDTQNNRHVIRALARSNQPNYQALPVEQRTLSITPYGNELRGPDGIEWNPYLGRSMHIVELDQERLVFLSEFISRCRYLGHDAALRWAGSPEALIWTRSTPEIRSQFESHTMRLSAPPIPYTHGARFSFTSPTADEIPHFNSVNELEGYQDDFDYLNLQVVTADNRVRNMAVQNSSADETLGLFNYLYGLPGIDQTRHYQNSAAQNFPELSLTQALRMGQEMHLTLPLRQGDEVHDFRLGFSHELTQRWLNGLDRTMPYILTTRPRSSIMSPHTMGLFFYVGYWYLFSNSHTYIDEEGGSVTRAECFRITGDPQVDENGEIIEATEGLLTEEGFDILAPPIAWENPVEGREGFRIEYAPVDRSRTLFLSNFAQRARLLGTDMALAELLGDGEFWQEFRGSREVRRMLRPASMANLRRLQQGLVDQAGGAGIEQPTPRSGRGRQRPLFADNTNQENDNTEENNEQQ